METAPLKAFATSARTELIREVTARITAVLSQGSPERVESPTPVASLEKEVAASGGGDKGKAHVADKVAYTWFNRIIALRFMDANGYTGIGVVSPAADQVGQPEVLAAAKRGQIDQEVVSNDRTTAAIAGLLNGTRQPRPGVDAQAEAYSLLLVAYCQFWHKAMPFMFERQGDFTELLIPANLLAGDSVLSRSVEVLTEDVCKDVEVIGWLYQFYISERKSEVFAGFKKNSKAGAGEIPSATQLFTPHWIVRYLVENSVGRLWMLNRPTSSLAKQMDYYIAPVDDETGFLKIARPEDLTIIDPACGSGHMLTYAFDLLYAIYEEEGYAPSEIPGLILANNLHGTEIDPRAGALAAFALTMKAAAKRKLFLKEAVEPNICVLEPIRFLPQELDSLITRGGDPDGESAFWNVFLDADTCGALVRPDCDLLVQLEQHLGQLDDGGDLLVANLIDRAQRVVVQARPLACRYAVVIANPPYMGAGNMDATLTEFVKASYPASKSDLFATFIERNLDLARTGGRVAMITMQSWMFLSSFAKLRQRLFGEHQLQSMAHLGTNAFDSIGGDVVSTTAFVLAVGSQSLSAHGTYLRLVEGANETAKAIALREAANGSNGRDVYHVRHASLAKLPGAVLAYWLSDAMIAAFSLGRPLSDIGASRQGMATSNNARFTRFWHEVSTRRFGRGLSRADAARSNFRWFPYNKGGDYRKWYGNQDVVVDWEFDGRDILAFAASKYGSATRTIKNIQFYFQPSISWSKIGTGMPAFRFYPQGFLFDVAGTSIFAAETELLSLAAVCNSSVAQQMLAATSPTMNLEVGTLADLPVVSVSDFALDAVRELIRLHRTDWDSRETSWDFSTFDLTLCDGRLEEKVHDAMSAGMQLVERVQVLETKLNEEIANEFGVESEVELQVPIQRITLNANVERQFGMGRSGDEYYKLYATSRVIELVSYGVGCMMGRYSLDEPGLILSDQGVTLQDYLTRVPEPTFMPDADNVIPFVDGDWFEDDIIARLRQFLRVTFGDAHLEENLRFVAESLGVKNLREYFITKAGKSKFYDDHVQRYKKRPIYWLFSSPKGSFNALIYLHRYTPSSASTVLTYLREYVTKLESGLQQAERAGNAKEADRLRKILVELNEYEHDTLYPLASENVVIDLDDGVKVNYPKLGRALRRISGLESSGD